MQLKGVMDTHDAQLSPVKKRWQSDVKQSLGDADNFGEQRLQFPFQHRV